MVTDFEKHLENVKNQEQKNRERIQQNKSKIDEKIFQMKVEKMNHILEEKGISFRFNLKKVNDHYEFSVPLPVLIGPSTRKFCSDKWNSILKQADINVDFSNEIEEVIQQISGISVVMKLNHNITQEVGKGEIKVNGNKV